MHSPGQFIVNRVSAGMPLATTVITTGYTGGDDSSTTIAIWPEPGFRHSVGLIADADTNVWTAKTDNAESVSITVRGDMELNGLRLALKSIADSLDDVLGDLPENLGTIERLEPRPD